MDDSRLVRVLKALADPTRFGIVRELAQTGEITCGELGRRFAVTQPTISHHLRQLGEAGLLSVRHEGQHHLLSLNREVVEAVSGGLAARLASGRRGGSRAGSGSSGRRDDGMGVGSATVGRARRPVMRAGTGA